jgi:hypothetical protein
VRVSGDASEGGEKVLLPLGHLLFDFPSARTSTTRLLYKAAGFQMTLN